MTVTTLRPSSTSSSLGWSAVPSGTLHGVTSDNNDATYALWSGSGSGLVLQTPIDSPPAGERRHQVRVRVRASDGDAWWSVILANGQQVGGASGQFGSSPETIIGSWGFNAPPDGPTTLAAYITAQEGALEVQEVYLDVDTREAPTFTPLVLNGAGIPDTTVTDTATPVIRANGVDLDDLSARQYRYWVTLSGAIVWDTGVVSGSPADRATTPLDNGSYVAHLQIWTTLGANLAYPSEEETLAFTVSVGDVPAPENPNVSPLSGTPFYEISACAPDVEEFDNEEGWVEIQRVDCPVGGYLFLPGSTGAYAHTDDPATALTDLQVTVYAQRDDDWRPTQDETLIGQTGPDDTNVGWRFYLDADGENDPARAGRPVLSWSPDGLAGSSLVAVSDARAPIDPYGRVKLRATLDVDNGAGGWTAQFFTEIDGEWVQLSDTVVGVGTTSIFNSTSDISVGAMLESGTPEFRWTGRIYDAEVRDGPAGTIIASPDFTGHMAGTDEFEDAQGNTWIIEAPAVITSDQRLTTVALLGPLATDECASWVDYSLPRTGLGGTCEHAPEACCSYYRSRTVVRFDGQIQISDWSNTFNAGVPEGMIVMWPATAASIPAGWERTTALDGRYPKGIPDGSTQPGAQGGASTHTHSLPTHSHEIDHSHTITGNTAGANAVIGSNDGNPGTTAIAGTHTHSRPAATSTADLISGTTSPGTGGIGNDPDRLDVIFIESNGDPAGVPDGALGITADATITGWEDHDDADGRFLKGASTGADGGTTAVGTLDGHAHTVLDHSHTGTSHNHTAADTGTATGNLSLFSGPLNAVWSNVHSHPITINSAASAALGPDGAAASGTSAGNTPPYRNVRVQRNISGAPSLPVGLICAWRDSLGSIPDHWQLCDGTNSTPNLLGLYPRGATASIGGTGGSLDPHTHTSPSHTHATPAHSHSMSIGPSNGNTANVQAVTKVIVATGTHGHTAGDTNSATPTVGGSTSGTLASTTSEPPYEEVAFVQLMEEPTPPAGPDMFCLTWSDEEHLIRTDSPDGPMWAPVLGKFTWSRDRPFTSDIGLNGTRFVTNAAPGERNLVMTAAVESEAELQRLQLILARPLVLISPSDSTEVWAAPIGGTFRVVKVGRIRQVTAQFIGTGPQPAPQLADMGT